MALSHRSFAPLLLALSAAVSLGASSALAGGPSATTGARASAPDTRVSVAHRRWTNPERYRQDVSVRFDDLDLTTRSDAGIMFDRIARAASAACTLPYEVRPIDIDEAARQACRETSIRAGLARLNRPLVTAAARQAELAAR